MHYLPFSLTLLHSSDRYIYHFHSLWFIRKREKKMRIAELTPTPLSGSTSSSTGVADSQSLIFNEIESSIKEAESLSPEKFSPEISNKLLKALPRLNCVLPLSESGRLQLWKLSYRLWNACVDLANRNDEIADKHSKLKMEEEQAKLRQIAADFLILAGNVAGIPSPNFKAASFFYKTGLIWHNLGKHDLAASCFERATDLTSKINIEEILDKEERKLLLDLNLARSHTAWEVSERTLALTLLNRSKELLFAHPESYRNLADQYLQFGKLILTKDQRSAVAESLKLLNEALELSEKGLTILNGKNQEEALSLTSMKMKTLRFMAAAHLQSEEYENVLKCVRVLKEGAVSAGGEHPSVPFLALKAWLGLGKVVEAEVELKKMVDNSKYPVEVCVSAVEVFFQAGGNKRLEAAKSVFLGLLGRCTVSAGAAVRVVERVMEGGGEKVARSTVALELVSDERVMALFAGVGKAAGSAVKDRGAMHAILWNSGAEHFRSKDYKMGAEFFEKSMLYIPYDIESRILRAKCFRVLCLCHLGLSEFDRAEEFIVEAEKLEANISCAFLKFKIYLQKQDESGAIRQIQAMPNCLDFEPEFLTLATHEAIASQALVIATASLSTLLSLYPAGKSMPMSEVAVLRNLIVLLLTQPDKDSGILKFAKHARNKMVELGVEEFFGKGVTSNRELSWFAGNCWNMGMKAGKEKNYELCAEFLELASEFYGAQDKEIEENKAMVCKTLILSVAAMINAEKSRVISLSDADMKKALGLLDRAGKILTAISTTQLAEQIMEPNFHFLYTFNMYELRGRLNDSESQLLLIKHFASSKACTPKHLLQLALNAAQGSYANPGAANFALNSCLAALLTSPFPDYRTVSLVIRKLVGLAGFCQGDSDDEVYEVYKQAYRIIVGLKEGEYPTEEAKWLSTTAWNRSGLPVRLGRLQVAGKWMKIGLELARRVPGMEAYRTCMAECFANLEKLAGTGSAGELSGQDRPQRLL